MNLIKKDSKIHIDNIYKNFNEQFVDIKQLLTFNEEFDKLASLSFESLAKLSEEFYRQVDIAKKIRAYKNYFKNLQRYPKLSAPVKLLYSTAIVQSVSTLEAFLEELFYILIKDDTEKTIQKFPKDLTISKQIIIKNGFDISKYLDILIKDDDGKKISFQDLQSISRVFHKYTLLDFSQIICNLKDSIILSHAVRHIIIHNRRIVDDKFLTQIRNTKFNDQFTINEEVDITVEFALQQIKDIEKLVKLVYDEVNKDYEK